MFQQGNGVAATVAGFFSGQVARWAAQARSASKLPNCCAFGASSLGPRSGGEGSEATGG